MSERFLSYSLSGLIPEECVLVLNQQLYILSLIRTSEPGTNPLVEQQQFTDHEILLIRILFENFPYYTPLEQLLAAYTGSSVEQCRGQILKAQEAGDGDSIMRPVRNILSRSRWKVHPFHFDIKSVVNTGYMLMKTA